MKTLWIYVFLMVSGTAIADGGYRNIVAESTMPRRICDVEIPMGLESNVVFDVVSVSGNQWYADARERSVTGSVFRTISCTYDYEHRRTISAHLRRRFEKGDTIDDCKANYLTVSQQLDTMNAGATIIRDKTIETSNAVFRIIIRGDMVRINLSLMNLNSPERRELNLAYAVPIK